jgi:hypothetical protein
MQDFLLQPNYNLVTNGELFPTLSSAQVFGWGSEDPDASFKVSGLMSGNAGFSLAVSIITINGLDPVLWPTVSQSTCCQCQQWHFSTIVFIKMLSCKHFSCHLLQNLTLFLSAAFGQLKINLKNWFNSRLSTWKLKSNVQHKSLPMRKTDKKQISDVS